MLKDVVGSGTGANYPITAGALYRLLEDGLEPRSLTGTSGSTIPFAFLAGGGDIKEFLKIAKDFIPSKLIKPNFWYPVIPGLFNLDKVEKQIKKYIPETYGECKIPLITISTDTDTGEAVILSSKNTPKVSLSKGIQSSVSVPWVFKHVQLDNRRLVDGGIVNNFAIDLPELPGAIGIRVISNKSEMKPWKWWASYSWNMIDTMLRVIEQKHIEKGIWNKAKILTIPSIIGGMEFHKLNEEMIEELYMLGYNFVDKKISEGWNWR